MQIVACRWELRRNYFYLTAWRQPNPPPIFHPPLQFIRKVYWIKMILMSNLPLVCFCLLYAYTSSSKHELSTASVTMKEDEKKPNLTIHLLRSGRPSIPHKKCFLCTFITIRLATFKSLTYGLISAWNTVCDLLKDRNCCVKSLNGLLWFVPLVYSNG